MKRHRQKGGGDQSGAKEEQKEVKTGDGLDDSGPITPAPEAVTNSPEDAGGATVSKQKDKTIPNQEGSIGK